MKNHKIILADNCNTIYNDKLQSNSSNKATEVTENDPASSVNNENDDLADVSDWNKSSQMAVDEITQKYQPNGVTADELIWTNAGIWKK
jgi:hypothetical protein